MKKAEFIKLWCDTIREGRKLNFPDMRPSEHAASVISDMKSGAAQWRKYRAQWARLSRHEVERILAGKSEEKQ